VAGLTAAAPSARAADGAADPAAAARAVVETRHEQFRQIVAEFKEAEPMRERIRQALSEFVDYDLFSKLAAKSFWDDMTPKQREEYLELFTKLIQRTYLKRFEAGKPFKVEILGPAQLNAKKDQALVKTEITSGKVSAFVDYKLFVPEGKDAWLAYDVVIDDVSVMRNYRTSFDKTWKEGGFDLLTSKMRKKLDKVEKEGESGDAIGDLE
jgi:phospholipid transport system substrate-binding protein